MKIDVREPPTVISRIKKYFGGSDFSIEELPVGDVQVGEIIVERKTIDDLLASIADNRLLNQAAELRQATEYCYLVICGPLTWDYEQKITGTNWQFRAVQGALLRVQELGVCVTYAADEQDFPATLKWILNRNRDKIITLWPRTYGVPMTPNEKILSSLPGIGAERSDSLLKKCGSVIDTLICLSDPDCELPTGISKKTRENVRLALGLQENEKIIKDIIK